MSEKARGIMKERFGVTLPALRGPRETASDCDDEEAQMELQDETRRCHPAEQSRPSFPFDDPRGHGGAEGGGGTIGDADDSNDRGANSAVEEMLASMPPHVRAVAERRPELVSRLLQQKAAQRQAPARLSSLSEEPEEAEEAEEDSPLYRSEDEINIDQESVSLLRRRISNR